MPKKKTRAGETVSISLNDIIDNSEKGIQLPSQPTKGRYEKNSRDFSYGNSKRNFSSSYQNSPNAGETGQLRGFVDFSNLNFSQRPKNVGAQTGAAPRRQAYAPPRRAAPVAAPSPFPRRENTPPDDHDNKISRWRPKNSGAIAQQSLEGGNPAEPKSSPFGSLQGRSAPRTAGNGGAEKARAPGNPRRENPGTPLPTRREPPAWTHRAAPSVERGDRKAGGRLDWGNLKNASEKTRPVEKGALPQGKKDYSSPKPKSPGLGKPQTPGIAKPSLLRSSDAAEPQTKSPGGNAWREKAVCEAGGKEAGAGTPKGEIKESPTQKKEVLPLAGLEKPAASGKSRKESKEEKEGKPGSLLDSSDRLTLAQLLKKNEARKSLAPSSGQLTALVGKGSASKFGIVERMTRASRRRNEKEDVLTALSKRQLASDKEQRRRQEAEKAEKSKAERVERIKSVEGLLAAKRRERVEFFGYFKGTNRAVDRGLWRLGLECVYGVTAKKLDAEFQKLTVWCLREGVLSVSELAEELDAHYRPTIFLEGPANDDAEEEEESEHKNSAEAAKEKRNSFVANILRLFTEHFETKQAKSLLAREKTNLASLLEIPGACELGEFLEKEGLSFLRPRENVESALRQLLGEAREPGAVLAFLRDSTPLDALQAEPEVSRTLGLQVFRDCFASLSATDLEDAAVRSSEEGAAGDEAFPAAAPRDEAQHTTEDEEEEGAREEGSEAADFFQLSFELNPKVAAFFEPELELLHFLRDVSLKHQRELLNALCLECAATKLSKKAAEGLMRAAFMMRLVSFDGIVEWRFWLPPKEGGGEEARAAAALQGARKKMLLAATAFLDGELEEAQRQRLAREAEEYEESDSLDGLSEASEEQ